MLCSFRPWLNARLPGFLKEFVTPIVKARQHMIEHRILGVNRVRKNEKWDTVDGRNATHQLNSVVYPMIGWKKPSNASVRWRRARTPAPSSRCRNTTPGKRCAGPPFSPDRELQPIAAVRPPGIATPGSASTTKAGPNKMPWSVVVIPWEAGENMKKQIAGEKTWLEIGNMK